ncbi:MAG: ABC transporter permease subunit, partial [Thermoplasmata archaeon]|nr:ABC transporter permease subunit [Thermoplasmata archaeon]
VEMSRGFYLVLMAGFPPTVTGLLTIVLVVVALVHGSRLFREELEDNTLAYLTTRRISKASLVAYKFLGYYGSALFIVTLPILASYVLAFSAAGLPLGDHLEVLGGFLAWAALGIAAFGGIFLLVGFVLKPALMAGLLYGFLWETVIPILPGNVPLLSVNHYLRSVAQHTMDVPFVLPTVTLPEPYVSVLVPLLVGAAGVVLTYVLFMTREIKTRD